MAKTIDIQVRCLHCRKWSKSPIWFQDSESFDSASLFANQRQCPKCGEMTGCNKDNFRARFEDGGFLGIST